MAFGLGKWRLSRRWRDRSHQWKKSIFNAIATPWRMITGGFTWLGKTISAAWNSRHFRLLIQGFPALFAVVGVGVLVANAQSMDRVSLAKDYLQSALKAAKNEKYDLAQSLLEKSLTLEGHKDETKFILALVMGQAKKMDHSFAIMRSLAPETANGYAPAHMWMGDYVDRNFAKTQETFRVIENHYQRAYNAASAVSPDSTEAINASRRLGMLFFARDRMDDAIKYLEIAAEKFPYERMSLAGAYQKVNRLADRDRALRILNEHCRLKLKGNVNDKEARAYLAMTLIAQEQFPEAIEVVRGGMAHDRGEPTWPSLLSDVFAYWDMYIAKKPETKIVERFGLVQQGLMARPTHPYHLGRLVEFSDLKDEDGAKAKKVMEEMLLAGQSAPIIHFLLGGKAHQDGRADEAKYHFEKAFALDPNFGAVANNLAWVLSHQKEPDHERALKIIDQAIEKMPGVPNFVGTRGQILAKMGRYKEALPELERGLKASPNELTLHESLAETHKALGNVGMADMHARKVEEIRTSRPKKPTELMTPSGEPLITPAIPTNKPSSDQPKIPEPKPKGG